MYSPKQLKDMKMLQRRELTDHHMYLKLAKRQKDQHNKQVLTKLANDELGHYHFWKKITKVEMKPNRFQLCISIFWYDFWNSLNGKRRR